MMYSDITSCDNINDLHSDITNWHCVSLQHSSKLEIMGFGKRMVDSLTTDQPVTDEQEVSPPPPLPSDPEDTAEELMWGGQRDTLIAGPHLNGPHHLNGPPHLNGPHLYGP